MKNIHKIGKELFITSNEEIKEGDWFITTDTNEIHKSDWIVFYFDNGKKITLTTDQDLIKDGVQAIELKINKMTAVEFLVKGLPMVYWEDPYYSDLLEQAKEMEKQQKDDFAIGFAMHISTHCNCELGNDTRSYTELLEIYKKEKGL